MHRRRFIALLAGAIALPCVAAAQQKPLPVIGWLDIASGALFQAALPAFREGLAGQGYIEGDNVAIAYRWAEGDSARLPALAAELVAMPVDVIVASGGQQPAQAAQAASRTIPIVSTSAAPIVPNFARPAANITGVSNQTEELSPKRLELLHDTLPGTRLIGFLFNPANSRGAGGGGDGGRRTRGPLDQRRSARRVGVGERLCADGRGGRRRVSGHGRPPLLCLAPSDRRPRRTLQAANDLRVARDRSERGSDGLWRQPFRAESPGWRLCR
jgi:putative tryptophan/tyrosine transport system substrate-binding protein